MQSQNVTVGHRTVNFLHIDPREPQWRCLRQCRSGQVGKRRCSQARTKIKISHCFHEYMNAFRLYLVALGEFALFSLIKTFQLSSCALDRHSSPSRFGRYQLVFFLWLQAIKILKYNFPDAVILVGLCLYNRCGKEIRSAAYSSLKSKNFDEKHVNYNHSKQEKLTQIRPCTEMSGVYKL